MAEVHVVRHKELVEGQSSRRVARELGVSRNTVKRYLARSAPVRVETAPRGRPVWEKVGERLEALLSESPQWTGGKQRLTATRLHAMLVTEGFTVGATTVKEAVAEWKRGRREVFVPLVYPAGDLAEVDFFEVLVDLAGKRIKVWMFVMRLMHSSRDFAWLYTRQDQVSFLDGHVRAFAHFGFVPNRIAYDNLKAAVKKHLVGSERVLASRFEALASHYLFEASFCRPRTGHDKGGVESRGKAIRWQHLVPIPREESLDTMRTALLSRLDATVDQERFGAERSQSLPLPSHPFDARRTLASVAFLEARSSAPRGRRTRCRARGLGSRSHVGADTITLSDQAARSVISARGRFGERVIDYRHYIPELAKKPQALRQVASELIADMGTTYAAAWRALVDAHGPKQAARVFAKVLTHVEERGADAVAVAIDAALAKSEPLLLALAPAAVPSPLVDHESLPAKLRDVTVDAGCAADYDALLCGGAS